MTPEGTVIDPVCTLVPFACGLRPDLFGSGAVLVPDIADPGAVAVVGAAFTMRTDGVTVGCIPDTLTRCLSSGPASDAYARHTPTWLSTKAFCFCLTDSIARTCSIAVGSDRCIVKPITTVGIGLEEPVRTGRLYVYVRVRTSEPSAEGKLDVLRATPLIVTRLPLHDGLGSCRESDGGSAATVIYSSRSGKGAPTGVGETLRDRQRSSNKMRRFGLK